jgi:Ca2+-binding RTX toxin-like protein
MAVQAFFKRGVSTVRSGNAAPDVPECADDAVGDPSAPMDSANNLKQIAIATHALDAGECSVDICGQNSPSAGPEPVTHAGWGPWEVVLSGHSSSAANTGYVNPSSFQIVSAGADAGSRLFVGNLAVHSEAMSEPVRKGAWIADVTYEPGAMLHSRENAGGGDFGHADVLLGAADRLHGDHGTSILEFSVENFPSMGGGNLVEGTNASETIDALDGVTNDSDTIYGRGGHDTIFGLGGGDRIYGGDGDDTIFGNGGNDHIFGGSGADDIDGGNGDDMSDYTNSTQGVSVSLLSGTGLGGAAEGDTLTGIEIVIGSSFGDFLAGDDGDNALFGNGGDDLLMGGGGADTLWGESGSDMLKGGGGADFLGGGDGVDTAAYVESSAGVFVSLIDDDAYGGEATGDNFDSIENLIGSIHADSLWGTNSSNMLNGWNGNDTLKGYGGADSLYGDDGADSLYGMDGIDTLHGDGGNDMLDGGAGGDTMIGGVGNDTYIVDAGGDVVSEVVGQGFDQVRTSVSYTLAPGSEVEVLETTDPDAATAIDLVGNAFNNTITGNNGANVIAGGLGIDTLRGNGGADAFLWSSIGEVGSDDVVDYSSAEGDVLHFTNIDADDTLNGNQDFTFIGTAAFTAPGQINWFTNGSDTFMQLNTDPDPAAEGIIQLMTAPPGDSVLMFL